VTRRFLGPIVGLVAGLLAMAGLSHAADEPGRFDFYVLSLSWSPTWCETDGRGSGSDQCAMGRRFGFVVHGLWPQFERGYPQDCKVDRFPGDADVAAMSDLMPERDLVRHEWRKHGACSGLTPSAYLGKVRAARATVRIPDAFQRPDNYVMVSPAEVEAAFTRSNPGLRTGGIAIICDGRRLREVRICVTRDLEFRACGEVDRRGCRADRLVLPPVR